jgi:hypothetical protein
MTGRIFLTLSLVGLFAWHTFGQQQAGQISGVVTDSTGAVTPGATVKAIEVGTGFVRTTVAGAEGEFVLTSLRPAEYVMTAEHAGFRSFRRTGIELLANQSLTLNIKLELGAVSETVTVAGAAVQVNTSTSTLSEAGRRNSRHVHHLGERRERQVDSRRLATVVQRDAQSAGFFQTGRYHKYGFLFPGEPELPVPGRGAGVLDPDQQLFGGAGE